MVVALTQGDSATLARIMRASHASFQDDYEASVPEVDRLADTIRAALGKDAAARGGVRMTGAGSGGCVVAMARKAAIDRVTGAVETADNPTAARSASANFCTITGGAREIAL